MPVRTASAEPAPRSATTAGGPIGTRWPRLRRRRSWRRAVRRTGRVDPAVRCCSHPASASRSPGRSRSCSASSRLIVMSPPCSSVARPGYQPVGLGVRVASTLRGPFDAPRRGEPGQRVADVSAADAGTTGLHDLRRHPAFVAMRVEERLHHAEHRMFELVGGSLRAHHACRRWTGAATRPWSGCRPGRTAARPANPEPAAYGAPSPAASARWRRTADDLGDVEVPARATAHRAPARRRRRAPRLARSATARGTPEGGSIRMPTSLDGRRIVTNATTPGCGIR